MFMLGYYIQIAYCTFERDYHTEIGTVGEFVSHMFNQSSKNYRRKKIKFEKKIYWTDPEISLAWIKAVNKEFSAFIKNR